MAVYASDGDHRSLCSCSAHGQPCLSLLLLLLQLLLLLFLAAATPLFSLRHDVSAAATALYPTAREGHAAAWMSGHASFFGGHDAGGTMGVACGYGNIYSMGYGVATTSLSAPLFNQGLTCGACFEIKCKSSSTNTNSMLPIHEHDQCLIGKPTIVVTATNLCPPNYNGLQHEGRWCNPPLHHFTLAEPLFHAIAHSSATIVPILYKRVGCKRRGGIHFTMNGSPTFNIVLVSNVGGAGDVQSLSVKSSIDTNWIPLKRSWGQNWQHYGSLLGQSISFKLKTSDGKVIISYEVVPKYWEFGQTFEGDQF